MKCLYILVIPFLFLSGFTFDEMPSISKRNDVGISQNSIQSYNSAISEVKKSVVNISTQKKVSNNIANHPMFNDPIFRQFFGDLYNNMPQDRIERSLGSGVIVSKDGYIVTNNHVIEDADKILVSLPNNSKKEYEAKLIGKDPRSDLAVIKINQNNLPYAKLGDSNDLMVGDIVFAIGNPFGVGESVTMGIISALNKTEMGINDYENFIQTDASINPGNSGGALVDSRGALIGINTAILSRTGGNHGIGFAIPSDMVKKITTTLIEKGTIERGYLGVGIQDVTENLSNLYNGKNGAVLVNVDKDGAAAKAGLKVWDLIVAINNKPISSASELKNTIGSFSPNEIINITYMRNKKEYTTKVKLGKSESDTIAQTQTKQNNGSAKNSNYGLSVENITNQTRQMYRLPNNLNGVIVSSVEENSKADNVGFEKGDIISQIEDVVINNIKDFNTAMTKYKNKPKRILVYQQTGAKTLVLD
ncbi:serine protease [Helicobacter sp. 16-1353]|uniref:Do family serine endopeptidase n=1 Tax=Helicobacter sp. 16-1353 TaxID=2004996 RepID=UPI000DCDB50B|nr:Do family serine endopeptidase [Helicobacter sp. 16-1353]RAX55362.1 serine protease [Helicobacter sp. 16-1353]